MNFSTALPGLPVDLGDALRASIRPAAATLPQSGIIEVVNYGRSRAGLIPLWVGEGDVPTPDFICRAAIASLEAGNTFYTYQRGIPELRRAVSDYHRRHTKVEVGAERVIITGSAMQAMMQTMQALVGHGDEVVIVSPVWPNIYACVHMQEAVPRSVTLEADEHSFRLDIGKLFDACTSRTRVIYVNTPGNPTGWIMPRDDMLAVRDFARERGIWILADEVYTKFTYDGRQANSFLEIMAPEEQLIVTNSFSKNWAMTGWRVGWAVIPPALGQIYENLVQYNTSGVPVFLQEGCIAALDHGDAFIAEQVARCRVARDYVCDALTSVPAVDCKRPEGAFYLLFRVDGEADSVALAKRLVDQANVGLAPGTAFGPGGEGFVRLCFATSVASLEEALARIIMALRTGS